MMNRSLNLVLTTLAICAFFLSSCNQGKLSQSKSNKTGVKYNKKSFMPQKPPKYLKVPGMTFIPGGLFLQGGSEKDIEYNQDNQTHRKTVQSFYMDTEEVSNENWKEFLYHVENGSPGSEMVNMEFNDLYPDTVLWARDLAFNEPLVHSYFQHPSFDRYPVVGITWHQANEYCKWRTSFVNASRQGKKGKKGGQAVNLPDKFRLPTEAEWEYAARGAQESQLYAWEGKSLRKRNGKMRANFKRGRGDYAGWAGGNGKHLNDKYVTPAPVGSYWANDFGLYNMSGNVAEWCEDTYRVLSYEDTDDLNPFRKKGETTIKPNSWLDDNDYDNEMSLLFNPDPNASEGSGEFDNVKVYRGGSWYDIAYYMSPGVRRFFPADSASNTIGFRCSMISPNRPD